MTEIVAADIGGTHARFAIAEVADGRVQALGEPVTIRTADHASLQTAWEAFAARIDRPLPRAAGIAVATPVGAEVLKFTNNPWVIRPALIGERLGVDRYVLVNDFAAQAHAVAQLGDDQFRHLCGPDRARQADETISIVGPGTGLGVAQLLIRGTTYHVVPTEGGHIDFAPLDPLEDAILADLREQHRRVSVERIVAAPGIVPIYATLARLEGRAMPSLDDRALWTLALEGRDSLANAAMDRFCLSLGAVAGDIALAQGATSVVIAGGHGLRLADHLARSGFDQRFVAKGRFEAMMSRIPVRLLTHEQPGLYGAAAAFAQEHRE
ncbi:glucokinase [Sphingomonas jatrophae]|uniref:Glucokinase n=1 Tax=Sphingomonas jatrophae TaxID=1166337 RepID=A0A1I6JWI8_9SPHN|nr:glucokinase [Sphingomonas jatrophae]SFR83342.1 glucokinase [Sphingomonas jatrophae]